MSEADPKDSNPNAGGADGLEGDMGVSSERTEFEGVEGTGTVGSAAGSTHGALDIEPDDDGPPTDRAATEDNTGEKSTAEQNTAEVPAHDFDSSKNPGHSHG